jgi:hypothetical protein
MMDRQASLTSSHPWIPDCGRAHDSRDPIIPTCPCRGTQRSPAGLHCVRYSALLATKIVMEDPPVFL